LNDLLGRQCARNSERPASLTLEPRRRGSVAPRQSLGADAECHRAFEQRQSREDLLSAALRNQERTRESRPKQKMMGEARKCELRRGYHA